MRPVYYKAAPMLQTFADRHWQSSEIRVLKKKPAVELMSSFYKRATNKCANRIINFLCACVELVSNM